MRTYGTIEYCPGGKTVKPNWMIRTEPHVTIRLKRCFAGAYDGHAGRIILSDTPEHAHDLMWFCQRYPLVLDKVERKYFEQRAREFTETVATCEQILGGAYEPRPFDLALPPRHYQSVAAELTLARGNLLLADDLGLGKSISALAVLSDPRARPALIVAPATLQRQWLGYCEKFCPTVKAHIIAHTHVYELPKFFGRGPEILICSYHKLDGWRHYLAGRMRAVIFDECQELRRCESKKWQAAQHVASQAAFRMGLSVGGNAIIEMRGGPFGGGWVGELGRAMMLVERGMTGACDDPRVVDVTANGIETRGWTGNRFAWKRVKSFIRHEVRGSVRSLFVAGDRLHLTDDHSVFVADEGRFMCRETRTVQLKDVMPVDDGSDWEAGTQEREIDVPSLIEGIHFAQVAVDLSAFTRHDLGIAPAWAWQNYTATGPYGSHLPLRVYGSVKHRVPCPTHVYAGRGRGRHWTRPRLLLSSWAYVLGFWLGNGWVSNSNRVCFAVKLAGVNDFMRRLKALPGIRLNPEVRKMRGASVEVRCAHSIMARIIESVVGKPSAPHKEIPGEWIVTWPRSARLELLKGMIDSDGHVGSRNGRIYYSTSSRLLAKQLMSLLRSTGVQGSLHRRGCTRGGIVGGRQIQGRHDVYSVSWSQFAMNGVNLGWYGARRRLTWSAGKFNEGVVRAISSVQKCPQHVYDLEVDGHPSFVANGVLVHNSATPIYNYGGEFFNVSQVLAPDALGTRNEFLREWCVGYSDKPRIGQPEAFGTFVREKGLLLRRTRADVGRELPPVIRIPHAINSDARELHKIRGSAAELARIILDRTAPKEQRWTTAGQFDMLLRQATGLSKAPFVADFTRMICESGEPVILCGWHRAVYGIWEEKLKDLNPVYFTGSETPARKEESKRRFLAGDSKVMFMSLRSGAGVDGLQEVCSTMVNGELDWSAGVHEQLVGRLNRDGQTGPVRVYYLISEDGSDPTIAEVLGLKRQQLEGINNPDRPVTEPFLGGDGRHVAELAQAYLKQKRVTR